MFRVQAKGIENWDSFGGCVVFGVLGLRSLV